MQDMEPDMKPFALFRPLAALVLAMACALPAAAQTGGTSTHAAVHGLTQSQVIAHFGEPERRHAPIPAQGKAPTPPIIRWDYGDFSIYFEKRIALHRVDHAKSAE